MQIALQTSLPQRAVVRVQTEPACLVHRPQFFRRRVSGIKKQHGTLQDFLRSQSSLGLKSGLCPEEEGPGLQPVKER